MKKTTRREFLKKSGFTMATCGLTGRALLGSLTMAANSALTAAAAQSTNDRILVVLQLAGGWDSLNTVIPMSGSLYSTYRSRRPTLAVAQGSILPIDADAAGNQLGFHPNLPKLQALFNQGQVSAIQAVGYPNPNRSHFESMAIWHSADPVHPGGTGWLGDYFDAAYPSSENPLLGVNIGGVLPLSLYANDTVVPAIGNVSSYRFQTDGRYSGDAVNRVNTFLAVNRELAPTRTYWDILGGTAVNAYNSADTLQKGVATYQPDPSIVYPTDGLGNALRSIAQIIGGNLGTKILYATQGGYDTHQNQNGVNGRGGHPALLQSLDNAVDAFFRDMQRLGKADKVILMMWTEFSRKVGENGDLGTDHAAAATDLVIGPSVRGGIVGQHPSLTTLDRDDGMIFSIDFRSIYATILENWLGVSSRDILGGTFPLLPLIR
jgi:uncharacterized protein (DUF1501 family)